MKTKIKKVLFAAVAMFVIALGLSMPLEVKAEPASMNGGTATYEINDGVLTIHSGTFEGYGDYLKWPWHDVRNTITQVVIDGPVTASGSLTFMFSDFGNLQDITGLSYLDTSEVTDMSSMFRACHSLTRLDLSSFDTKNVTTMHSMFAYSEKLAFIDLSNFNTSNVTDMMCMFQSCESLKSLDVSSFDTSKVTEMSSMFERCYTLPELDLHNFDTSNVVYMGQMFYICTGLKSVDVSSFDTSNVTSMGSMFQSCESLTSLDLSHFDTSKVKSARTMFFLCKKLEFLDLSSFDLRNANNQDIFRDCSNLKEIVLGENFRFNWACYLPTAGNYSGRWMLNGGNIKYTTTDIEENYPSEASGLIPGSYIWANDDMLASYTVLYDANGGVGEIREQHVSPTEPATVLTNWFSYGGYQFNGWNTASDGSGISYTENDSVTFDDNHVLYAQWKDEGSDVPDSDKVVLTSVGGELSTGSYYLDKDVTLSNDLVVNEKVTIDLNGHVLRGTGASSVILVGNDGTLTIKDSGKLTTHYYKSTDGLYQIIAQNEYDGLGSDDEKGIIYGGIITGGVGTNVRLSPFGTGEDVIRGGAIDVEGGKLFLYAGTLCGNNAKHDGSGISVRGELSILGGNIIGNTGAEGVYVNGNFSMSGGKICHNVGDNYGGGVVVLGTFNLTGGKISENILNNISYGHGAGVLIQKGKMFMSGGEISNNSTKTLEDTHGSGVCGFYSGTEFIMSGGIIKDNKADYGGGVADFEKVVIQGGEISGNTAFSKGGGILAWNGTMELRGGIIEANHAQEGAGIYFALANPITITDVKIVNNIASVRGGGILASNRDEFQYSTIRISGSPFISGNLLKSDDSSDGKEENVYLYDGFVRREQDFSRDGEYTEINIDPVLFEVIDSLSNSANIGVTTEKTPQKGSPVTITKNYELYNPGIDPRTFFSSDNEDFIAVYNATKTEAVLSTLEDASFTATFQIGDTIISKVPFTWGDKALAEPKIPDKPNYVGEWESYDLANANSDITIQGIYTPISPDEANDLSGDSSAEYKNGNVTITLNASAPSKTIRVTSKEVRPLDVILVLDQSGSMASKLGEEQTKREALISCANSFVQQLYQNSVTTHADHRVAVVGFAYDSYNQGNYKNTGLLATANGTVKNYRNLTTADYSNALLSINSGNGINTNIIKGINAIAADGATAADLGLTMAKNIFSETTISNDRERIVIFITDGTPTCWGETPTLIVNTAAKAITVANTIKTAQSAKIYSIGVEANADPEASFSSATNGVTTDYRGNFVSYDFNRFLHAISSNYPNASSIAVDRLGEGDKSTGYYMAVNDTGNLGSIFNNILYDTVYELKAFDKATISYTLTNDFILTLEQELDMYQNLKNSLGLDSENISVTRNADGTTDLIFKNVPVKQGVVNGVSGYYATVSFAMSAAKDVSGTINTGASSSVSYGSGDMAVSVDTAVVNVPANRSIIVFKLNGKVYRMIDASFGDQVTVPISELATWTIPAGTTVKGAYSEFEATSALSYNMHWIINGVETTKAYAVGDPVTPPSDDALKRDGYRFLYWTPNVPLAMPPHDVTCTAVYTEHTHHWVESYKTGTCDTGITTYYTCDGCEETKSETGAVHSHSFTAVLSNTANAGTTVEKVVCTDCGYSKEQNITFKVQYSGIWQTQVLDLSLSKESEVITEPDNTITMRFYIGETNKTYKVTRIDADGTRHEYATRLVDGYLVAELDHFSIYTISESDSETQAEEITFEDCQEVLSETKEETLYTAPTAKSNLTYTGSAQALIDAGSATEGNTMYYAAVKNSAAAPSPSVYQSTIPTAVDAGTYYVWYKAVSDGGEVESTPAFVTVTIQGSGNGSGGSSGGSSGGGSGTPIVKVTGVSVQPESISLATGETAALIVSVSPENATNKAVAFSSSDTNIASVANGTITAVGEGTATITVTTQDGDFSAACNVTVRNTVPQLTGITLDRTELSLKPGETESVHVIPIPSDDAEFAVNWVSASPAIATVSDGKITALADGVTVIIATTTDGLFSASVVVSVESENQEEKPEDLDDFSDLIADTTTDSGISTLAEVMDQVVETTVKENGTTVRETKIWIGGLKKSYPYKGSTIKPVIHVYDGLTKLTEKTDYTLSYGKNKKVGTGTITVKFKGNYNSTPTQSITFAIEKADFADILTVNEMGLIVKGQNAAQKPSPKVVLTETGATFAKSNYQISYKNEAGSSVNAITAAGTYTVEITPKDTTSYTGSVSTKINVIPADGKALNLNDAKITLTKAGKAKVWTGEAVQLQSGEYTVRNSTGTELQEGTDFVVTYLNNIDAGTASLIVSGTGDYVGSTSARFTIKKGKALSEENISVPKSVIYLKGGVAPTVSVVDGSTTLTEGVDYTVSYKNNKKVGTGIVIIKGKGNYKFSLKKNFTITAQNLSGLSLKVASKNYSAKKTGYKNPGITITDLNGKPLAKSDYSVESYDYVGSTAPAVGTAITITIKGKGNYSGTISGVYQIISGANNLSKAKTAKKISSKAYTGSSVELTAEDLNGLLYFGKDKKSTLIYGTDFIVSSYSNNLRKGTAKVTLTGVESLDASGEKVIYGGEKTINFKITQKKGVWKSNGRSLTSEGTWTN